MVQPASVDLRLGPSFRVFHNHRVAAIDLADPPTQPDRARRGRRRRAVRHPPRRVLPRAHRGVGRAARRHRRPDRGQVVARAPRADRPRDGRLRRPRLPGHADARDHQPDARADHAVARQADRAAVVHDARRARRAALRPPRARQPLPRPGRGDRDPLRGRPRAASARDRSDRFRADDARPAGRAPPRPSPPRPRSTSPGRCSSLWAFVLVRSRHARIRVARPHQRRAVGGRASALLLVAATMAAAVATS